MIGVVAVQPRSDRRSRNAQRLAAGCHFDGLKVPFLDGRSYKLLDLREDLCLEDGFEAPFFASSCEAAFASAKRASHSLSLTSTSSLIKARNLRYSAICARVVSTASVGISLVMVLPETAWVSDQIGP
jgi:hypothetical protein